MPENGLSHATPFFGGGLPGMLDTGEEIVKTAKSSGKMKFTFKGKNAPPCGANGVTVCGEHKDFDCRC